MSPASEESSLWLVCIAGVGVLCSLTMARCHYGAVQLMAAVQGGDVALTKELVRVVRRTASASTFLTTLPTSIGLLGAVTGLCLGGPTGASQALHSTAFALAESLPMACIYYLWVSPTVIEALGQCGGADGAIGGGHAP